MKKDPQLRKLEERLKRYSIEPSETGCWIWQGPVSGNHAVFKWQGKSRIIGRVIHEIWIGPLLRGQVVTRTCNDTLCVNPAHLVAGRVKEHISNGAYQVARGEAHGRHTKPERTARGERKGNNKLTREDVVKIRELYQDGKSQRSLARDFGVSKTLIAKVVTGASWAHVAGPRTKKGQGRRGPVR